MFYLDDLDINDVHCYDWEVSVVDTEIHRSGDVILEFTGYSTKAILSFGLYVNGIYFRCKYRKTVSFCIITHSSGNHRFNQRLS